MNKINKQNSALWSSFCQIFNLLFGQWSIKTKCFWDLLTFIKNCGDISKFFEILLNSRINKKNFYLIFFADLDETDVQSNESLQKFFGALPLIGAMLAAIGYQFGLSPIAWSYSGKFHKRYHLFIKSLHGILKNQNVFT